MELKNILACPELDLYMIVYTKHTGSRYLIFPLVILPEAEKAKYKELGATHVLYHEYFKTFAPIKGLKPKSCWKFDYTQVEQWQKGQLKTSVMAKRYPDGWGVVPVGRKVKHKRFMQGVTK